MQLLGTTLQCVPALPGSQRHCYSAAAEVGDIDGIKVHMFHDLFVFMEEATCSLTMFFLLRYCGNSAITKALKGKTHIVR